MLRVALAAGNFLNAGSRAGAAAGFHVSALLKLREARRPALHARVALIRTCAPAGSWLQDGECACTCTESGG